MRLFFFLIIISISNVFSQELVLGEERIEPGIIFIFEGAIKDKVYPKSINLDEKYTDIHIEARVNWDDKNIPDGTPIGGFVPYLNINATITNERTGQKTFVDLTPHLNLIDNFHYARNISLPGSIDDFYKVTFSVLSPMQRDVALHRDWLDNYGEEIFSDASFSYKDIYFGEICRASRK